jgi:recombinational DNA repair ATPase RecF
MLVCCFVKKTVVKKGGKMKVQSVSLQGITVFISLDLELSDGINIIIGENRSCKTNLLKLIYHT